MIPELGQIALLIALALSLIQAVFPLIGAQRGITSWMQLAFPAARLQLFFVFVAFALLTYSFLVHDFSVAYVAENSNTQLPTQYLFSAVWGGHEGSLLLWALTLSAWTGAVTWFSRSSAASTCAWSAIIQRARRRWPASMPTAARRPASNCSTAAWNWPTASTS